MRVIWKHAIERPSSAFPVAVVMLPAGARLLSVAVQNGQPVLYEEHDTAEQNLEKRSILLCMTGEKFPEVTTEFLGTLMLDNGSFVLHVYEAAL